MNIEPLDVEAIPWVGEEPTEHSERGSFPDTWQLLDDVQLMALPDPVFIVDGIIQQRGVGVLYAPPGAGKTTLIASLLTAVATGTEWFGHRVVHKMSSVYVATEDVSGFKVRLRAAKRAAHLPLETPIGVYTFPEAIDLRDPVSIGRFGEYLRQAKARLPLPLGIVVVDTYAAGTPGSNENSSEDMTIAMSHADQWRNSLDITAIYCHHTNAGGTRERGHSAMRGSADFMIAMTPSDDVIQVEASKQRNGESGKHLFNLKLVPAPDSKGCVVRLASDVLPSLGLTPAQLKVYSVLRDTFSGDGAAKSEWQRTCADVAERTFHRACKALQEDGYVKAIGSHFRITAKGLK